MSRPQRKAYLLRWNPNVSSFTPDGFDAEFSKFAVEHREPDNPHWTIWDYRDAKCGDLYFMMKVGTKHNGIVWAGMIDFGPYQVKDSDGNVGRTRWIDMTFLFMQRPEKTRILTAEQLNCAIPEVDWEHGHSGELLPANVAERLALLVGDSLLHKRNGKNLAFHSYEEKWGVICDIVGYLSPALKQRLLDEGRIDEYLADDLADGVKYAITDLTVDYDECDVKQDTRLEDILFLTELNGERVLSGGLPTW